MKKEKPVVVKLILFIICIPFSDVVEQILFSSVFSPFEPMRDYWYVLFCLCDCAEKIFLAVKEKSNIMGWRQQVSFLNTCVVLGHRSDAALTANSMCIVK